MDNSPLFGGATSPSAVVEGLLEDRLRSVGVLYLDRDRVPDTFGISNFKKRLALTGHTKTSRAMFRVTGEDRRREGARQLVRLFKPPPGVDHPDLWPWVIDYSAPDKTEGWQRYRDTTSSWTARQLNLVAAGHRCDQNTRLWFPDLGGVVFACAWPWLGLWSETDMHRTLVESPSVLADWLCSRADPLGEALAGWVLADDSKPPGWDARRLEAALRVFDATAGLRAASSALQAEYTQAVGHLRLGEPLTEPPAMVAARDALLERGSIPALRKRQEIRHADVIQTPESDTSTS
jgi:hypothetical protein